MKRKKEEGRRKNEVERRKKKKETFKVSGVDWRRWCGRWLCKGRRSWRGRHSQVCSTWTSFRHSFWSEKGKPERGVLLSLIDWRKLEVKALLAWLKDFVAWKRTLNFQLKEVKEVWSLLANVQRTLKEESPCQLKEVAWSLVFESTCCWIEVLWRKKVPFNWKKWKKSGFFWWTFKVLWRKKVSFKWSLFAGSQVSFLELESKAFSLEVKGLSWNWKFPFKVLSIPRSRQKKYFQAIWKGLLFNWKFDRCLPTWRWGRSVMFWEWQGKKERKGRGRRGRSTKEAIDCSFWRITLIIQRCWNLNKIVIRGNCCLFQGIQKNFFKSFFIIFNHFFFIFCFFKRKNHFQFKIKDDCHQNWIKFIQIGIRLSSPLGSTDFFCFFWLFNSK